MPFLRIAGTSLLLLLVTTSSALAQGRTLGVRVGTSVATVDIEAEEVLDEENRTGLVAGVFYNQTFGVIGYQLEVLYAKRGADFGDDGSLDLSYVTIPALLKVGLPTGVVRPSLFGGVALALNVGCEVDENNPQDCDDVTGLEVKDTDWNAVVGADLQFGLGGAALYADGRYYVGLTNIAEIEDVVSDVKHRSWEFTAGVGIPLL